MLGDIAIAVGIIGGLVTLLDVLLSENQKEKLQNATLRLWMTLDRWKSLSYLSGLRNKRFRLIYTFLVAAALAVSYSIKIASEGGG